MVLSYWDLWFALVTDADFDSSWDRMIEHFRSARKTGFFREDAERKLCHLRDLQQRLQQATIEISDIVSQTDPSPTEFRRARNQVLKRTPRPSEWSDAMRYTPKKTPLRPCPARVLATFS